MDELLEQFLIEGRELVEQASADLLALERAPRSAEHLDSAFRAFHTLKGSTGFFDFAPMGRVLHDAEDVLGAFRSGEADVDGATLDALLACIGQTERWLDRIEHDGALPADAAEAADQLSARLRQAGGGEAGPTAGESTPEWAAGLAAKAPAASAQLVAVRYAPSPQAYFRGDDPLAVIRTAPGLVHLEAEPREPWGALDDYDPFACNLVLSALFDAPLADVRAAFRFVADEASLAAVAAPDAPAAPEAIAEPAADAAGAAAARTLRVDAERIERLAAVVDDLVVTKNAIAHLAARAADGEASAAFAREFTAAHAALDRLATRLHGSVTRLRLVPLAPLFRRFARLVRDTAAELGRDVDFRLQGEEVEVDKRIVDGLFDPLLHLLRNALDHGVEPPAERRAAGKAPRAIVLLSARAVGDQVLVEVTDDGRGIDANRIRAVAVGRGLLSDAAAAALSDEEAIDLVFTPGFSTAREVSAVSGRGVGMDAVRSAVSALGGRVSLRSRPGLGSTVQLTLPLSVVLTRIMIVEVAGERFGAPIDSIVETARVDPSRLIPIRAGYAFTLRDQAIPVLWLADLLGLPRSERGGELKVLVLEAGGERIGVAVDALRERIDAPLRATNGLLTGLPGVVGATLEGDGRVLMVLDLQELIG